MKLLRALLDLSLEVVDGVLQAIDDDLVLGRLQPLSLGSFLLRGRLDLGALLSELDLFLVLHLRGLVLRGAQLLAEFDLAFLTRSDLPFLLLEFVAQALHLGSLFLARRLGGLCREGLTLGLEASLDFLVE